QGGDRDNRGSDSRGSDRDYDRGGHRRGGSYDRRDSRGYDNQRSAGYDRGGQPSRPASSEDEVLLPGESLAKYRGRPAASAPSVADRGEEAIGQPLEDEAGTQSRGNAPASAPGHGPRRFSGSLPRWLLSDAATEGETAASESEELTAAEASA